MSDRPLDALIEASTVGVLRRPMIDVARVLVGGGWPVFPCGHDKAPLVSGGFKSRSDDIAQVEQWWGQHPDAMPAICPGDRGLAALDIDTAAAWGAVVDVERSEEHTSELQSPDHLVCRLLLEKKK